MSIPTSIIPSLPAESFTEIRALTERLGSEVREFQIDMVDGHFAKATSWPFTEENPRLALDKVKRLTQTHKIEFDCMLMHPEQYLDLFQELKLHRVLIHIGSTEHYNKIFQHAHHNEYKVGIACTNDDALSKIKPLLDQVQYIQVMGIAMVGKQGQPFDERTLETVAKLRSMYPEYTIAVDGSVNRDTIVALRDAGANRFAPGSAITKAHEPRLAYEELKELVAHS